MSSDSPSNSNFLVPLESIWKKYFLLDLEKYITSSTVNIGLMLKVDLEVAKLPEFKVVCSPDSPRWKERVEEELRIFEIFRELQMRCVGFCAFDDLRQVNSRSFECKFVKADGRAEGFKILLSLDYPKSVPLTKYTDGVCLGKYEKIWKKNGTLGIAHYLTYIAAPIMALRGIF
ncbi:MAG: hypothetical protein QXO71_10460 [Candidatus Jordarchaeaceae archaeon]